ncbi:GNAT family N-acetyltransferase [Spirochaeta cellobiosiphila]|uniref:GNAT family N-acetyltransferase n=1 Tax=Spirochaeta cellobiosiphila TaxID=504483 RepID=UPI00041C3202|nr:GNAT family N-acetyltransferase [Spirochaeta cellobiosiphila]
MNDIKIKCLESDEINNVVEMIIKDKNEQGLEITEEQSNSIKNQLKELVNSNNALTLIAKNNKDIVGYINGHIIPFPLIMNKECYISCLLVNSEQRGNKIGHQLLVEIENKAKKIGCCRLILNNPKNADSYKRHFYAKENFTERVQFANFIKTI